MHPCSQLLSYPALSKHVQDWTRSASLAALARTVLAVGGSESRLEDARAGRASFSIVCASSDGDSIGSFCAVKPRRSEVASKD